MSFFSSASDRSRLTFAAGLLMVVTVGTLHGQTRPAPTAGFSAASGPLNWTTQQDHKNMMDQLGIKRLRPGPSGQSGATNSANYDSAKANPYPHLPDPLTLKNGRKVCLRSLCVLL